MDKFHLGKFFGKYNLNCLNIMCGIIILLLMLFTFPLKSQTDHYVFEHITPQKGLSQSTILTILQDYNGFLWLGTQEGLNRFDGYAFKIFKYDPKDTSTISDNWITVLYEDSRKNLWIGTNAGGLNKFDRESNRFVRYEHDENNPYTISSNRILSIHEDRSGTFWIGTEDGGLNRFDIDANQFENYQFDSQNLVHLSKNDITTINEDRAGNLWWGTKGSGLYRMNWETGDYKNFRFSSKDPHSVSNDEISYIYHDSKGILWIGTDGGGLNRFNPQSEKFDRYKFESHKKYGLSDNHVYAIHEDSDGMLWIGTDGGLNKYHRERDIFYKIEYDSKDPRSLSSNMVRSIYKDKGGILWIGTYRGLNKFDSKKAAFIHYLENPADPNSLSNKNIWSICEDKEENLWIGTNKGLNFLERKTNKFVHYQNDPAIQDDINHDVIRVVYIDRLDNLWIGTDGSGICKFDKLTGKCESYVYKSKDKHSISNNSIRTIYEDSWGNLWIGTLEGLNLFDRETRKFKRYLHHPMDPNSICDNYILTLYEDRNGALWIGTIGGLSLLLREKDIFITFKHNPNNPASLSNNRILCAFEDNSNRLWFGTYGGGLENFDRDEFVFRHYTEEDGLPNNAIYGILGDKKGNLWISTNKGISKFNPDTKEFKNYDVNDGLQGNEFNINAYYYSKRGEMFFGGINGLTAFYPNNVKDNVHIPPIVLSAFKKYDKEVLLNKALSVTEKVDLSYKDDFFSFEFAALDFTNPQKNQYAYKLDGFDKEWIFSGSRRYANYTNLDGGTYTFHVKGANNDGVWNETGKSIEIVIAPPFWQSWWFRGMVVVYVLLLVYIIVKIRMKNVNSQKRKLELDVIQRTRELNLSNYELLRAKKGTDDILNNVNEGLFLLDRNFRLGAQYSLALEKIFNNSDLADANLLEILENKISAKLHQNSKEFLELMFNEDVDEEVLQDLNPLTEVKLKIVNKDELWNNSKYLTFNFQRIYEEDKIQNLIVTVTDTTKQVMLAQKLEKTEEHTQKQMEWLVNILHIDPPLLNEFINGVERDLIQIESLLEHSENNGNLRKMLEEISRTIHIIKGDASLLDLKFFANLAHEFEEKIDETLEFSKIQGKHFIPLVVQLSEIRQSLNEVKNLIDKISKFHQHFRFKRNYENELLIKSIKKLIDNFSKDLKKDIKFIHEKFDVLSIPYEHRLLVKEILIQLVRNSITHGIESPEERSKRKKNSYGTIQLSSEQLDDKFTFKLRDDGRGIQIDKLREKAVEKGLYTKKQISNLDDKKVAELIFEAGFSTADEKNLLAGRGIGMDLIKTKVQNAGGNITVDFESGKFCEFTVEIYLHEDKTILNIEELRTIDVEEPKS